MWSSGLCRTSSLSSKTGVNGAGSCQLSPLSMCSSPTPILFNDRRGTNDRVLIRFRSLYNWLVDLLKNGMKQLTRNIRKTKILSLKIHVFCHGYCELWKKNNTYVIVDTHKHRAEKRKNWKDDLLCEMGKVYIYHRIIILLLPIAVSERNFSVSASFHTHLIRKHITFRTLSYNASPFSHPSFCNTMLISALVLWFLLVICFILRLVRSWTCIYGQG